MVSLLDIPLHFKRQNLPALVPLREVQNETERPFRLEVRFENWRIWIALVPHVAADTSVRMHNEVVWIPSNAHLRAVELSNGKVLREFGPFLGGVFKLEHSDCSS